MRRWGGKTCIDLAAALALTGTRLDPELESLVVAADAGDAVAQCELALWLLERERPGLAREWFAQSAHGGCPDAMCWLGQDLLLGSPLGEALASMADSAEPWGRRVSEASPDLSPPE